MSYPKYNYKFDFLASFMEIKLKKKQIYKTITLKNVDFEYQFIKGAFEGTIGNKATKVVKIEKIYNRVTFEKFTCEVRYMLNKYPNKSVWELVKMMFNGPKSNTDPKVIYSGEYGIDQRFAANGMYGRGLYFADNSAYSINFC